MGPVGRNVVRALGTVTAAAILSLAVASIPASADAPASAPSAVSASNAANAANGSSGNSSPDEWSSTGS